MKLISVLFLIFPISSALAEGAEFKIGVMLCLTGECAEWGNNSLKGIQLAVKELNSESGILGRHVKLVVEDTREGEGANNAISAYQNLILNPDVQFIIGPTWSMAGAPLAPIIAKNPNIIVTSPSLGIADFNEAAGHIFNVWPHDSYSTEKLASYAISQGWSRGVIFDANDPWGVVQADTFERKFQELGGTILKRISNAPDGSSFKGEALMVKKLKPEFVFNANMYKLSAFAKDLRRLNYEGAQITILVDETRIREAQGALEGVVFARYPDSVSSFLQIYQEEYHEKPGVTADTAYDIVKIYEEAINRVASFDVSLVQKEILKTERNGASGKLSFDAKGGALKTPAIYQIIADKEIPILSPK